MSSRRASDNSGGVLSFTFLDVLMCTMGSLLLLLVVFGVIAKKATRTRRDGEESNLSLAALTAPVASNASPAHGDAPSADQLAFQLDQLRRQQGELDRLREEANKRRREEQQRISHLEEHERRLEHELAKLHLALEALDAAEKHQAVDDEQAQREVERLRQIIDETVGQIAQLRKDGGKRRSYAIVPYKGANGTFRRPVFIECTADAVTIQPEGIRLTAADFDGPLRSGNPLAAAIRAAQEELNARAAAAGQTEMPDPYPLLIVRPDGAAAYAVALDAIRSWDSVYGYEFVEADWKIQFPATDPRLGQVMAHAVDEARQRQAILAKVAPRRYAPRLGVGSRSAAGVHVGSAEDGGDGFGQLTQVDGDQRIGQRSGDARFRQAARDDVGYDPGRYASGASRGGRGQGNRSPGANFIDEFAAGSPAGGEGSHVLSGRRGQPASGAATGASSDQAAIDAGDAQSASAPGGNPLRTSAGGGTPGAASAGALAGGAPAGAPSGAGSATSSAASGGGAAGAPGASAAAQANGSAASGGRGGPTREDGDSMSPSRGSSAAESRGVNWANAEASRRASPITRPIRVAVSVDGMSIYSAVNEASAPGAAVSFHQPVDGVMDQLAAAVNDQVADWGLAGNGMYWRPTLLLAVAPGAERQAARLAELLEDSGLDVRLPQTAARPAAGAGHATR